MIESKSVVIAADDVVSDSRCSKCDDRTPSPATDSPQAPRPASWVRRENNVKIIVRHIKFDLSYKLRILLGLAIVLDDT